MSENNKQMLDNLFDKVTSFPIWTDQEKDEFLKLDLAEQIKKLDEKKKELPAHKRKNYKFHLFYIFEYGEIFKNSPWQSFLIDGFLVIAISIYISQLIIIPVVVYPVSIVFVMFVLPMMFLFGLAWGEPCPSIGVHMYALYWGLLLNA